MPDLAVTLLIVLLAGGLGFTIAHLRGSDAAAIESPPSDESPEEFRPLPQVSSDIRKVASDLLPYYNASAYAADLLDEPMFSSRRGVALQEVRVGRDPAGLLHGGQRDSGHDGSRGPGRVVTGTRTSDRRSFMASTTTSPWTRFFALRALAARTPEDETIAGRVLSRIDDSWSMPINVRILREFLELRAAGGEKLAFGTDVEELDDERAGDLMTLFDRMPPTLIDGLREGTDALAIDPHRPFAAELDRSGLAARPVESVTGPGPRRPGQGHRHGRVVDHAPAPPVGLAGRRARRRERPRSPDRWPSVFRPRAGSSGRPLTAN